MDTANRFQFKDVAAHEFWGDSIARFILNQKPDYEVYTCAAGISPSGIVHFGNFRDVITTYVTANALRRSGKQTRLIFSWDNFDRLRKVPAGVDLSFSEHLGKPLSKVPDPFGAFSSYAERFQTPFVEAMNELGMELEYLDQTQLHEAGVYDDAILLALTHRQEIADILLSFMTKKAKAEKNIHPEQYRESYYPIAVYSRFTGKDNTTVLGYDGGSVVTYKCRDTNRTDTVDLSKEHIAKLGWKIDWPMRWQHEKVCFEPGGHDHASPGGSYDVASIISQKIFEYAPPVFAEYKFVGIQGLGAKMSGSKGNAVSPKDLLEIYEPALLKWLYLRRSPNQSFELAFDAEIYRQYDEFDREVSKYYSDALNPVGKRAFEDVIFNMPDGVVQRPIPFRQLVGFGQIVQWNEQKLEEILRSLDVQYDSRSLKERIYCAHTWLTKYNPDEKIELLGRWNQAYFLSLDEEAQKHIASLQRALSEGDFHSIKDLEALAYSIPKTPNLTDLELKKRQRAFFKDVYNLLIGKDTGPRLGTFLWAVDREKILRLLDVRGEQK